MQTFPMPEPMPEATLHEFLYDENGNFVHRVHQAAIAREYDRPERDTFWFEKTGSRACVTRENLDKPRHNRYYTLVDDPDKAKAAIMEALEKRKADLFRQMEQVHQRIELIRSVNPHG